jgi:hypothetical protein
VRLRHFVLTNFNVALPGVGADRRGATVRDAAWLDERCDLFERFCLPSMRGQSCREFDWLVRWEEPADRRHAARIAGYAGQAGLRLVDASLSFRRAVAAALAPGDEAVLTTRLDNDDALHHDALARLRAAALAGPPELVFFDLPVGYQSRSSAGRCSTSPTARTRRSSSPSPSASTSPRWWRRPGGRSCCGGSACWCRTAGGAAVAAGRRHRRRLGAQEGFLFASYVVCVAGTAALWFVVPGMVWLGLALFVVSNVAFSFGENFAAAFLPEISTPENIGRISGFGWGLGYFGGLFSLLASSSRCKAGDFVAANVPSLRAAWLVTAAFFAVAGHPDLRLLRERAPRGPRRGVGEYARVGYARVGETFRSLGHFRDLARFLAVFFVFTCGLAAVINFSAIYAKGTLAFTGGEIITLFLVVQISSAAGALGFGWIQDRLGALKTVRVTLVLWVAVCVVAYLATNKATFWAWRWPPGWGSARCSRPAGRWSASSRRSRRPANSSASGGWPARRRSPSGRSSSAR